jgi:uncharacterized protein YjbI with pentapeptide repeats/uncharacterized RDD family membrane protein YckC
MANPTVRRSNNKFGNANEESKSKLLPLATRRIVAWATEISLIAISGLIPFGIGVLANSRSDLNRVPLNPLLVSTERTIARPLALPISLGTRNVAFPTNFLWSIALLAPLTLSGWQLYLLARTGSTVPKRWFGIRVITDKGTPPGWLPVLIREGAGRWTLPISAAYLLWRYGPLFPNLGVFTGLAVVILLAEGLGFPKWREGRALHDRLAGTYTIDMNGRFQVGRGNNDLSDQWLDEDDTSIASVVITPESRSKSNIWRRMRRNPSLTLFLVALLSMAGVLATLVGTQVYIQTQANRRQFKQRNSEQFFALVKQLDKNSTANLEQRRNAILAMGTLNDSQSSQYLVDMLAQESNPALLDTIQQALEGQGLKAIADLKRINQSLASELASAGNDRNIRQQRLQVNQRAINKILSVYSGKLNNLDMGRIQLGQSGNNNTSSFNLVLDNTDLSGVIFKGANLNQASLKGSRFRGFGEDRRWDTFDDTTADLSGAQMKQANLTGASLSRVVMNRTDLSRATLNKANLSNSRLVGANLSSAQLVEADLHNAVMENASLTGADLGNAKLNEADLFAARLGRAIAIGTQLSFANLTKTDWQGADLSGANLDRANLTEANFSAARLSGANLRSAQMQNTNFRNSDLRFADLRGANVDGADFQGAILTDGKQDPSEQFVQTPAKGIESAMVKGVDFSKAKNLEPKQVAYICSYGGIHPKCP